MDHDQLQAEIQSFWTKLQEAVPSGIFRTLTLFSWGAAFSLREECVFALQERNGRLICSDVSFDSHVPDEEHHPFPAENELWWGEYDDEHDCFKDFIGDWRAYGEE